MKRSRSPAVCSILPLVTIRPTPVTRSGIPHAVPRTPVRPRKIATAASLTRQHELSKFFAGGMAGAVSTFLIAPLDVLRTRMQASCAGRAGRSVAATIASIAKEGIPGFYRGLGVGLIGTLPSRSIYFGAYSNTKSALMKHWGDSPIVHLLSAVCAGAVSNFVMSPLWVVRTRLQLSGSAYLGYLDASRKMLVNEGIGSFYRGYSASLWGTSEAAIHFVMYEKLKKLHRTRTAKEMTPLQYTLTAALSKTIASVATYPHERVRVLMREIPKVGCQPKYRGMVQSLKLIAKEEGWKGLYRGIGVHLARSVPNTAIMFLSYELISKQLEKRHRRRMMELAQSKAQSAVETEEDVV